ncbi:hypothetical protein [Kistimonas asteriae]|uniref:hypothetical protein n=1 Tax=Kistimonas asteriae TaxID=517724 RepID=UPI001BAC0B6F|nr:hypothetical protein [Kistimonas asteriae]
MPVSTTVSPKKRKSRSELLSEKLDQVVADAEEQITRFATIKNDLGYDPDLIKEANEKGLVSGEDLKEAMQETNDWKTQLKNDIKEAVSLEKRRQKAERKEQRKMRGEPEPAENKSGGRKRRGKFI